MSQGEASLPFELPEHMRGLEDMVITDAQRLGGDFERACGAAAVLLDQRVHGYWALARIATNPESLPYKLRDNPNVWNPPPLFNPYKSESGA